MGTIAQKIRYTKTWIDDIEFALQERGIDTSSLALEHYGEAIRSIQGGSDGGNPLADYDRINSFKINTYNNYEVPEWFNEDGDMITLAAPVELVNYQNQSTSVTIPKETDATVEIREYINKNISDTTGYTFEELFT